MPFSIKAAATAAATAKRPSEGSASEDSPAKRTNAAPLYANLTLMDAPKRNAPQRLPATAPVILCIYKVRPLDSLRACARSLPPRFTNTKVTDRAGDAWSNFEGTDAALYQVQIDHTARPSVTFGSRAAAKAHLQLQRP